MNIYFGNFIERISTKKKYFYRQEFISGSYEPEEKFDSGEKE